MPCFRCDARQTDPIRGDSPWQRGVVRGQQVLVCPDCQQVGGWADHLDHCSRCGSARLVKALGAVACRSCGLESWPDATVSELQPQPEPARISPSGREAQSSSESTVDRDTSERHGAPEADAGVDGPPDFAAEVSAALERVLPRGPLQSSH